MSTATATSTATSTYTFTPAGEPAVTPAVRYAGTHALAPAGVRPIAAEATSHLRLTRRGRVVVTTLAAIPLVAAAAIFAINGGGAAASAGGAGDHFRYQVVQSGDSLWSIAERVAPNSDPRDVVARIVSLNQLSSSMVTPGQRVAIPAEYAAKS